jgi:hypothetical protein
MMDCKQIGFFPNTDNSFRMSNLTSSDNQSKAPSRFQEDFIQKEPVGKGKFGRVVRCQNKLDQLDYAVKITTNKVKCNNLFQFTPPQTALRKQTSFKKFMPYQPFQ